MSLRNRIAFYFMTVTALLTALLFMEIYSIVFNTVYDHLDDDLKAEYAEVSNSIIFLDTTIIFANENEWNEPEHGQVEVNPTFIMVVDTSGKTIRKTSNLLNHNLKFHKSINGTRFFDEYVGGSSVRQIQSPIVSESGVKVGYVVIAIPLEESALVLSNLKTVLIISFPVMLIVLFAVSRLIAGRIISPVDNVITTAEHITRENLKERISIPPRKDELFKLTETINNLLDRLQDTVLREKQFTADASHELRTPLSIIKGTLEVLIRKEREPEQYREKIKYVIEEVNRMATLIDQLLSLARYESGKIQPMIGQFNLTLLTKKVIERFSEKAAGKQIEVIFESDEINIVSADASMTEIILENLISNAIKYSNNNSTVKVSISNTGANKLLSLKNHGPQIPGSQIKRIFDRFYRADETRNAAVEGSGLGLAIVKRLSDLQNIGINAASSEQGETTFSLTFPNN